MNESYFLNDSFCITILLETCRGWPGCVSPSGLDQSLHHFRASLYDEQEVPSPRVHRARVAPKREKKDAKDFL